jgi:hypothetical protein
MTTFESTLKSFCDELSLTFPELSSNITRVAGYTPAQFWRSWKDYLPILATRDAGALQTARKGLVIGPVCLNQTLWDEVSGPTKNVIWRYLRTLLLEAVMELNLEGLSAETSQLLLNILMEEKPVDLSGSSGSSADTGATGSFDEAMNHLKPLLERLKSSFADMPDLPDLSGMPMPEIPERLRNGRIAKLAEEMAKQFDPADFGIDPSILAGDNVEEILKRLADLYQRDPSLLMTGAKRVAEKIKRQIMGGSLNREELVSEAQEFIALFKDHPMFKEIIEKVNSVLGEGGLASMFGSGSSGAPSERLRNVQDRLRAKLAARGKTGPQSK